MTERYTLNYATDGIPWSPVAPPHLSAYSSTAVLLQPPFLYASLRRLSPFLPLLAFSYLPQQHQPQQLTDTIRDEDSVKTSLSSGESTNSPLSQIKGRRLPVFIHLKTSSATAEQARTLQWEDETEEEEPEDAEEGTATR